MAYGVGSADSVDDSFIVGRSVASVSSARDVIRDRVGSSLKSRVSVLLLIFIWM